VSFKAEVIADRTGEWCANALRFATREEADAYVRDLSCRWTAVQSTRVIESSDNVNAAFTGGRIQMVDGGQNATSNKSSL
jgi:hypothetical protein